MTQPYECEVRFGIDDIEDFQATLSRLGAKMPTKLVEVSPFSLF